jgi:hypothetical protein
MQGHVASPRAYGMVIVLPAVKHLHTPLLTAAEFPASPQPLEGWDGAGPHTERGQQLGMLRWGRFGPVRAGNAGSPRNTEVDKATSDVFSGEAP